MITQSRLKEVLSYDQESGLFIWTEAKKNFTGRIAGSLNQCGYRQIKVDGRTFVAHRLAWLYVYGEFPSEELDHINRNRDDNRISNLRPATRQQNCRYSQRPKNNKSGVIGVSLYRDGKWRSDIRIGGRQVTLGYFSNKNDAVAARLCAERVHYGEFAPNERTDDRRGIA